MSFISRLWHRIQVNRSGVAMTEFAITAPIMLMLGLGGVELANYVMANLRISQMAMSVADNAGRVRTSIDESDISELMVGALKLGEPLSFASNGRIILSDLEQRTTVGTGGKGSVTTDNPNGYRQWIRWQRCAGALSVTSSYGLPLNSAGSAVTNIDDTTNSDHGAVESASVINGMGSSAKQISASSGTAVMVVEVIYDYQPVIPSGLITSVLGKPQIRRVIAFAVRQRTAYTLRNDGALTGTKRADCRLFNSAVTTT